MNAIEKIQAMMEERRIRAAELARRTGIDDSRISKWFAGTGVPNIYQGYLIAKVLGVPLEWLADTETSMPPPSLATLDEDERTVLRLTRELGGDEAIRRLLATREKPRFLDEEGPRRKSGA